MKKVLFASTALVAFAGAAAADITLTGNAEMGINENETYTFNAATNNFDADGNTGFFTDIDVTFTMSGETDGGLTFGASIDLDESNDGDAFGSATQGGETIFLSGNFGTITMGDTDGALDWALDEVLFSNGSLADNEETAGYNGNAGLDGLYDGQILRYDYTVGSFGIALSAELDDTDGVGNDDVFGLGLTYDATFGSTALSFGIGLQTASVANVDVDTFGLSVSADFGNGFEAGLSYMTFENHLPDVSDTLVTFLSGGAVTDGRLITPNQDTDHIGVGIGYSTGPWAMSANYGEYSHDRGTDISGLGLTVGYDLGGGAIVQFGYGRSSIDMPVGEPTFDDRDTFSFGVRMNF
ncbi:MAG: porin [Pseudomonadota bacterium]